MQQTKTMIYGSGKLYLVYNYKLTLFMHKYVCTKQYRLVKNLLRKNNIDKKMNEERQSCLSLRWFALWEYQYQNINSWLYMNNVKPVWKYIISKWFVFLYIILIIHCSSGVSVRVFVNLPHQKTVGVIPSYKKPL